MSQISRKFDPNYCVLARIVCIYLGFADLLLRIDQPSQSSQMFDACLQNILAYNTVVSGHPQLDDLLQNTKDSELR